MKDDFEATFIVELAPDEVWQTLTTCTLDAEPGTRDVHYVLPGWPSFPPLAVNGASCTLIELQTERLLRVRKDHEPCAGTEIAVTLEQAESGTRVTVVQSGFGKFLDMVGRDTVLTHGQQIANDFRLFLERGLSVPGTVWGAHLGAQPRQTGTGIELVTVYPGGFAQAAGLRAGDLLLTLRGIRLHDLQQLWTVLALTEAGSSADATWARGRESMSGKASFPG